MQRSGLRSADIYGTFVIKERHGLKEQALGLWGVDLSKHPKPLELSRRIEMLAARSFAMTSSALHPQQIR